ncbi:MAG: amino acid ABC transporter substrate-binding protein, partial [Desulfobacterales bacterium]|nr:amino acid ABC transporter substrate-binding protein [Desulfobacterales bacterium]
MYRRIFIITTLLVLFISIPAFAGQSVTIVCEDDFAPYGYQSKSGGAAGFSTDVIIAAYKSVDVDVKFKVMPYARGMSMIAKGAEIGCYNTNNDEVSLREYHFPGEPLFLGEMVIWARADYEGEMTVDKLIASGETVGVTNGYNYDGPGVNFDYNDKIKKDVANTVTTTLKKLVKGRYNFAAAEKRVALLAIARNKAELDGKVKVVGLIAHPGLYLSFSKKHPEGKKFSDLLGQGIKN